MGKGEAGPWAMTAFRMLARLKFLRGTWLDPFRNSDERKLERRLVAEYEADIEDLIAAPRAGEPCRSRSASRACPRRSGATGGSRRRAPTEAAKARAERAPAVAAAKTPMELAA